MHSEVQNVLENKMYLKIDFFVCFGFFNRQKINLHLKCTVAQRCHGKNKKATVKQKCHGKIKKSQPTKKATAKLENPRQIKRATAKRKS